MPASEFTKKATTAKDKRQWDHVYKSVLASGGSHADAVIRANGVIKKGKAKPKAKTSKPKATAKRRTVKKRTTRGRKAKR